MGAVNLNVFASFILESNVKAPALWKLAHFPGALAGRQEGNLGVGHVGICRIDEQSNGCFLQASGCSPIDSDNPILV